MLNYLRVTQSRSEICLVCFSTVSYLLLVTLTGVLREDNLLPQSFLLLGIELQMSYKLLLELDNSREDQTDTKDKK